MAALNPTIVRQMIEKIEFFDGFSDKDKDHFCRSGDFVESIGVDTLLIKEGAPEKDLYVLIMGTVDVLKEGESKPIATLRNGAIFGEISFFSRKIRTTSIRTADDAILFKVSEEQFLAMECEMRHAMSMRMVGMLVTRLEKMSAVMAKLQDIKMKKKNEAA